MSESHKPGVYAKGDKQRTARTTASAVALTFDGYKRVGDLPSSAPAEQVSDTSAVPDSVSNEGALDHTSTYVIDSEDNEQ